MGDSNDSKSENAEEDAATTEKTEKTDREAKTIVDEQSADKGDSVKVEEATKKETTTEDRKENVEESKTETILSSQSLKSSNPSISMPNDHPATPSISTPLTVKEKYLNRNQSDILPSLREVPREEDPSLMIFSSKGLPTKKYFRRREINSTVLPFGFDEKETPRTPRLKVEAELTPKISQTVPNTPRKLEEATKKAPFNDKNPNIPNPSVSRNVLTGRGVNSKDEFKSKSARRKDGNPVLGVGYDEPVVVSNVGRVPPGGFSSGLW
ncbi:microtubule-associated protein Jupiter-like [Harmonia axyridis]|uniref:microtubule-associated protein Jupiter-like n=1 Tax=Harmonia axyridis TaxID=115357 RepID=UPI001E275D62|nr:microtubule-associated protein Jupiter-like [Harmonia axyridis]